MADNIEVTAGSGTTIAADDIGAGVLVQRVKLGLGADGTAVDAVGGSGVDSTGVQRVSLATNVALPAGTNAIGKLAANSGVDIGDVDITSIAAGDNNIGNVDVVTLPALPAGTNNIGDVDVLSIVPGVTASSLGKAEDAAHSSGDTGVMMLAVRQDTQSDFGADGDYVPLSIDGAGNARTADEAVLNAVADVETAINDTGITTVAHGDPDTEEPLKIGVKAIAHGTNPATVDTADVTDIYANLAGVLFTIGGHPNVITRSHVIADSDGAQTDAALLTVSAGSKIVITQLSVKADASNTTNVAVKIGFGTATIPAASLAGTVGIILEGQFAASGGQQVGNGAGIIAVGADNEDLRITCGDPVTGNLRVTYSYYTVAG